MIISLIFGTIAGALVTQIEPKLAGFVTNQSRLRLSGTKMTVLAFAVCLFVAAILAGMTASANAVWLLVGGVIGYLWQEIRDLIASR